MHLIHSMRGLAVVLLLTSHAIASHAMLERFQWNNRILLVFAPSEQDPRYRQTQESIKANSCRIDDRDIVIGWLPTSGEASLGDEPIAPDDQLQLRSRYQIQADDFTVLLIGKDGTEKDRIKAVPDLSRVFGLIDTMPMRRQEMAANPPDCEK